MEVEVVRLDPDDWPIYKAIRLEALESNPQAFGASLAKSAELPEEEWRRRLVISRTGAKNVLLFARIPGGDVIGMIGGTIWDDPDLAIVTAMFVRPRARGFGVGERLVRAALQEFIRGEKVKRARLTVNKVQVAAVALYQRMGFEAVGETTEVLGDGKAHNVYVMEKSLTPS